jgi:hypothetical protein
MVALACGLVTPSGRAQTANAADLLTRVDHLVYGTPDLPAAIEKLDKLLGVRATPGGQHPGRGTRNALIALGPASYLEIIGPDPEQPKPDLPRPFGLDALSEPRLVAWAAKESDLETLESRVAAQSITLGDLIAGSRRRPDGVLLAWRYTNPRVVVADGIVPFFIDWGETPHPAVSAAQGASLLALRAEHPDASHVQAVLGKLGLGLPVAQGMKPALVATISSPRGRIELR